MNDKSMLAFHPALSAWFDRAFGEPTDVQSRAWASIGEGKHTLIAAPTGSGKTLAALLPCLDKLVRAKEAGHAAKGVRIVYVTPLKALNNDIHHHALRFVDQIGELAASENVAWPGIRSEVRTGDTSAAKRAAILRNPPDLLVTTPESLFLMMTSDNGRAILETAEQVIVDEIHDLAATKRGAHLSLTLERMAERCRRPLQRIGVSATQKPLERVASFLAGWEEEADGGQRPRPVSIVESAMSKTISVTVTVPDPSKPAATREAVWLPLLDRILQATEGCRSVLIFVNNRRLCERLSLRLNDHVGYEMSRAHHGSIARERRLEIEHMLKQGELRCIVATSSLELGIDVGHIDLVVQIDSPQEAARGIQRIGRAGHAVGEASRGLVLSRQKAALPEIAVLSRLISLREIEEIRFPPSPMDVLSQQIVAMASMDDWPVGALHRLVKRSDSYRDYPLERLEGMLEVLAGLYPFARPLLNWDRKTNAIGKRSNSAMAAITGAGTIPQSGAYPVHHLDSRAHLGELDEEFIQESRVGDVFLLGSSSWMIREIKNDRVYVTEAGNGFSEIPFWRNEAGGRSYGLGAKVGAFLREVCERLGLEGEGIANAEGKRELDEAAIAWLEADYAMDRTSAEQLIELAKAQASACAVPTDRQIVVEHYRDVANQTHVIVHNHCGRQANRAWLLALERQFEKLLPYKLYGNAKDNGIEFVLPEWDASWLQALTGVTSANIRELLAEAVTGSPLLAVAFRKIAETSLLLSRSFTRTPMWQKRLRSEELLKAALPYAGHFPYLDEAMSECLRDYLRYEDLKEMLDRIAAGDVRLIFRETPYPSPFAAQFIADYVNMRIYEGDGIDDTVRMQLLNVSKEMAGRVFGTEAFADAVGKEVLERESRRLRDPERKPGDANGLFALMKQRGDATSQELASLAGPNALEWLRELDEAGRAVPIDLEGDGEYRWICADERDVYDAFPGAAASVSFVLGRYVDHLLSFTDTDLCERYPSLPLAQAKRIVEDWVQAGIAERAPHAQEGEELWSSAKVASRIVRLTIQDARDRTEPVDAAKWCGQIALMQHALQGTQQLGSEGLRTVVEKLQGFYLPLSHWETIIFPARMTQYKKEDLDLLCASGEVLWIGRKEEGDKEGKVAFFLSDAKPLYDPFVREANGEASAPSRHPELLKLLREGGASFLTKLSRDAGKPPSELLPELLELVWEGRVSNDQFAPLRLHANPRTAKHANWAKTGSGLGRWYATETLIDEGDGDRIKEAAGERSPALNWARHLLGTYGLINRELVARTSPIGWDTLYPVLKRLEEWGALTRGTFIRGLSALQFTTRELSESVRKPTPDVGESSPTVLSSADPANPYGVLVDWPEGLRNVSFSRKPGNFLLLKGDRWLYWFENNGKRIYAMPGAEGEAVTGEAQTELLLGACRTIIRRQKLVKVVMELWNGEPIVESETGRALQAIGAERDYRSLVVWAK